MKSVKMSHKWWQNWEHSKGTRTKMCDSVARQIITTRSLIIIQWQLLHYFHWFEEMKRILKSFHLLNKVLSILLILDFADPENDFIFDSDESARAMGAIGLYWVKRAWRVKNAYPNTYRRGYCVTRKKGLVLHELEKRKNRKKGSQGLKIYYQTNLISIILPALTLIWNMRKARIMVMPYPELEKPCLHNAKH